MADRPARVRLAQLSFRDAEAAVARGAAALVPMGSTEEHGPHSPLGDYVIAEAIAVRVAEQTGDIVTPVIPFSYSEYFRDFPGTITLHPQTLTMLVQDVCVCLIGENTHRSRKWVPWEIGLALELAKPILAMRFWDSSGATTPSILVDNGAPPI